VKPNTYFVIPTWQHLIFTEYLKIQKAATCSRK